MNFGESMLEGGKLCWISMVGGLLTMMRHQSRGKALLYNPSSHRLIKGVRSFRISMYARQKLISRFDNFLLPIIGVVRERVKC